MNQCCYPTGNELYHYGVKGMRWGHRKTVYGALSNHYQKRANKAIAKIGTSKTRLGKRIQNSKAYRNEYKANKYKSLSKDASIKNRYSNSVYGRQNLINRQTAASNYYSRQAGYSKTRFGKTVAESASFNNKQWAKANQSIRNSKNVKEYGQNYVNAMFKTPVKTWSGRTISSGKHTVENMLPYIGTVRDIQYYRATRKKK